MPKLRPVFSALLGVAAAHYEVGWRYTFAIPRREWRMRLACAWPLLIGEATIAALARHENPLAATQPVKVPRARVRAMLSRSIAAVWSNRALAAEAARAPRLKFALAQRGRSGQGEGRQLNHGPITEELMEIPSPMPPEMLPPNPRRRRRP